MSFRLRKSRDSGDIANRGEKDRIPEFSLGLEPLPERLKLLAFQRQDGVGLALADASRSIFAGQSQELFGVAGRNSVHGLVQSSRLVAGTKVIRRRIGFTAASTT